MKKTDLTQKWLDGEIETHELFELEQKELLSFESQNDNQTIAPITKTDNSTIIYEVDLRNLDFLKLKRFSIGLTFPLVGFVLCVVSVCMNFKYPEMSVTDNPSKTDELSEVYSSSPSKHQSHGTAENITGTVVSTNQTRAGNMHFGSVQYSNGPMLSTNSTVQSNGSVLSINATVQYAGR
jgi:hypothetical protein